MLQQENENVLEQVKCPQLEGRILIKCFIVAGPEIKDPCAYYSSERLKENVKKQRPEQKNLKDRCVSLLGIILLFAALVLVRWILNNVVFPIFFSIVSDLF